MNNVKLVTTEKFGEMDCNFYRNMNGDILLTREQIGRALEYSDPMIAISKIHERHRERLDKFSTTVKLNTTDGKKYNTYLYTLEGCLVICELSHNFKALEFSKFLLKISDKNEKFVVLSNRKEVDFINELEEVLKHFMLTGIKQYQVLSYRIDYYISKLNIAIEFDENNHNTYTYKQHEGRQKEIEKELDCKFIRVSDQNSNGYNIGFVLKELFSLLARYELGEKDDFENKRETIFV